VNEQIDRETWLILAERLEEIRLARELEEPIRLEFDDDDQARVVCEWAAA
jgi:hypothetical protein